ncbi:YciI family protein [Paenibacillus sp. HJGM_3]|uniref:YciI family protein n=1 Tax=Paenibacillus sp. HJGM_3 TaxID=3379816 RepID=UPI00385842BF
MIYVAMLTIVDPELNAQARPAHLDYLNRLFKEGKVVMAGPYTDKQGGMVLYKTETEAEARQLAEADPVVVNGSRTLVLREWNPLAFPLD